MPTWLLPYADRRVLAVLAMGFSSGLPLALTFGTLSFWLREAGIDRTTIGWLTAIGSIYSLKFLWAPVIDRAGLGAWTRRLGRRRGWALAIQIPLAAAIAGMGFLDPRTSLTALALAALLVAFLSASQDIVIDAYRIELLDPIQQGAGAAATQWGYRFGMMASSAGVLYIVERFAGAWQIGYLAMAGLMGVGIVTVILTPEPAVPTLAPISRAGGCAARAAAWLNGAVAAPLRDFATRPAWAAILLFVVLYKFGDALAGAMANPFYVDLRFTRDEIATISKVFGVWMTLAGVAAGGIAVYRLGYFPALLVCGVLQAVSNLGYALQAWVGHDTYLLTAVIAFENFTGGMGSAAFVAYISGLCNVAFTASQYALLSSLATVGRSTLSANSGWMSEWLGWPVFFTVTSFAAVPGLLLLLYLMRRPDLRMDKPTAPVRVAEE